jgi:hypothetical protein
MLVDYAELLRRIGREKEAAPFKEEAAALSEEGTGER